MLTVAPFTLKKNCKLKYKKMKTGWLDYDTSKPHTMELLNYEALKQALLWEHIRILG